MGAEDAAPAGRPATPTLPADVPALQALLATQGYIAGRELATTLFLALKLQRPLFLEGEPGTGKTEIARALSAALGRRLIRLQCHEGLDLAGAAYEWNYGRQMLEIRLAEAQGRADASLGQSLFDRRFLLERPLLQALEGDGPGTPPPVLLVDELDRADEPFEAYLLEVLGEFQLTIPELGTVRAAQPPLVVLTSNRSREVHDAVRRRCLYHWVDYPDAALERQILARRVPEAPAALSAQVVAFVQMLREMDLAKRPGISETIDWVRALLAMDAVSLDPATLQDTLGVLLKGQDDLARVRGTEAQRMLDRLRALPAA